jgi:hypothetical protein
MQLGKDNEKGDARSFLRKNIDASQVVYLGNLNDLPCYEIGLVGVVQMRTQVLRQTMC